MTDTSTEAVKHLEEVFQKAKRDLRERVVCYLLWKPVTVGDFLDRIDTLAAERDALKAEVERLRAALVPIANEPAT